MARRRAGSSTSQSCTSPSTSCSQVRLLLELLAGRAEREADDLEHVAQALRRDPHVVELRHVRRVADRGVERVQLVEPRADDARRVLAERAVRIEPVDRPRLHDVADSTSRSTWPAKFSVVEAARAPGRGARRPRRGASEQRDQAVDARPVGRPAPASGSRSGTRSGRRGRGPRTSASAVSLTSRSSLLWCFLRTAAGSYTSSAARSRREATRIECSCSMSRPSSVPSPELEQLGPAHLHGALAAAAKGASGSILTRRAFAIRSHPSPAHPASPGCGRRTRRRSAAASRRSRARLAVGLRPTARSISAAWLENGGSPSARPAPVPGAVAVERPAAGRVGQHQVEAGVDLGHQVRDPRPA